MVRGCRLGMARRRCARPAHCGRPLPAESQEMGRHVDYLRGRAWMGLGDIALKRIDLHEARRRFDIAVDLLQSGEPETFKADLEEIADIFERDLGDEQAAEQLRQIAERAASA